MRQLLLFLLLFASVGLFSVSADADPTQDKLDRTRQLLQEQSSPDSTVKNQTPANPNSKEFSVAASGTKMFQQLGILVGILLIGVWAFKKWFLKEAPVTQRQIKILDRILVDPRTKLTLIEVEGNKILVGHNGSDISLLNVSTPKSLESASKPNKEFDIALSEELKI